MRVWIDQDLCTGDGLCTDHCPELFVLLEDGISYVHDGNHIANDPGGADSTVAIAPSLETAAINAALDCPGECIFIEPGDQPCEPSSTSRPPSPSQLPQTSSADNSPTSITTPATSPTPR
jgi:ferredoxin